MSYRRVACGKLLLGHLVINFEKKESVGGGENTNS